MTSFLYLNFDDDFTPYRTFTFRELKLKDKGIRIPLKNPKTVRQMIEEGLLEEIVQSFENNAGRFTFKPFVIGVIENRLDGKFDYNDRSLLEKFRSLLETTLQVKLRDEAYERQKEIDKFKDRSTYPRTPFYEKIWGL